MHGPDELTVFVVRLEASGVPYMITGATAAILYGQPRVTNDLDVVVDLDDASRPSLLGAFPETEFYLPPEAVIRAEQARLNRGHFNIIHLESGYKADVYLTGHDPLHRWALPRRRHVSWSDALTAAIAPPEYVILRKLEFYREGGSAKHASDIRAILEVTGADQAMLVDWIERRGLGAVWRELNGGV